MTLPWFATTTATVKTYPVVLEHGTPVVDRTGTAQRRDITGCSWQPGVGAEDLAHRDITSTVGQLFCPGGTVIDGKSIVEIGGRDYSVIGEPADWSAMPLHPHVAVALQRWEG